MTERDYTRGELESFVKGIREAAGKIKEIGPDYLIVPINGGVPLFDTLCIVDRELDPKSSVYFPTSSKIKNCAKVTTNCFENFFLEKEGEKSRIKLASIDEIVSGHSVCRSLGCYSSAARNVAKSHLGKGAKMKDVDEEKRAIEKHFPYTIVGLKEEGRRNHLRFSPTYQSYVKKSIINPIEVSRIITMDNPDYHTPRFDHPNSKGFTQSYPWLKGYKVTEKYLTFLEDVARIVGVDPKTVNPQNLARMIEDSKKYSKKPKKE